MLSAASIYGLRMSRNTPVVDTAELPSTAARAAILLHDEGYGWVSVGVAVRAVEGAAFVYYAHQAADQIADPGEAMEAGIAYGEAMGFVFDADLLARDSSAAQSEALRCWQEFSGPPSEAVQSEADVDLDLDLELDAVLELELDAMIPEAPDSMFLEGEQVSAEGGRLGSSVTSDHASSQREESPDLELPDTELPPPAEAAKRRAFGGEARTRPDRRRGVRRQDEVAQVGLSKFRNGKKREREPSPDDSVTGGAALGRIPLVRRRTKSASGNEQTSALLRLLSSF